MADLPETAVGHLAEAADRTSSDTSISRLPSVIFLAFVAVGLLVPLVQTMDRVIPAVVPPIDEHRLPASFPPFRLLLGTDGAFAKGLNAWFDDRVGFRDLFIRTKNQIDLSVFRTSRKVYVGKDGWLFGRGGVEGVEAMSAADMRALGKSFLQLADRLRRKGIRLIIVGYPDKSRVYPDMVPPGMPVITPGGNYDQLRHFLATQPSFTFIDAEELMRQERSQTSERLFAKTDLHPTQIGSVPIVTRIIAEIARLEGRQDIHWNERFTVAHTNWAGGVDGRFLSLLNPTIEADYPYFDDLYQVGTDEPDGKWDVSAGVAPDRADDAVGRPYDWEFRSNPDLCPQRLPGTVLFGNSFSDFYWPLGMHRYFCFIRRTREPMSRFKLFYQTIPTDTRYMIFQYVTFWLPNAASFQDYDN